jgi:hypothetical protein
MAQSLVTLLALKDILQMDKEISNILQEQLKRLLIGKNHISFARGVMSAVKLVKAKVHLIPKALHKLELQEINLDVLHVQQLWDSNFS